MPYGVAVTASGGASVSLAPDDVAGPPAISAPYGGGLVGLFATGVSSTITANNLVIGLPSGGGNTAAKATAGGHITFLNSANIALHLAAAVRAFSLTAWAARLPAPTSP